MGGSVASPLTQILTQSNRVKRLYPNKNEYTPIFIKLKK